ncbi:hypothetical protein AGOR_G00146680 [Albula goreensis]|uniref:trypsin n=1 Tax=Albula goreensis TaxID=1534307 RepID=A0A8T3D526_9TELE|nr:hypothetical protein AGOR_G00146680 [Albula goreensis]
MGKHLLFSMLFLLPLLTEASKVASGIIGGHEAKPHSRPYMAFLSTLVQDNKRQICGGVLLREDFVMTAAHCKKSSTEVWLGVHDVTKTESVEKIRVKTAIPHPDYNFSSKSMEHDIMLLQLETNATLNSIVKTIALPGSQNEKMTYATWDIMDLEKETLVDHWCANMNMNNQWQVEWCLH